MNNEMEHIFCFEWEPNLFTEQHPPRCVGRDCPDCPTHGYLQWVPMEKPPPRSSWHHVPAHMKQVLDNYRWGFWACRHPKSSTTPSHQAPQPTLPSG